QVWDENADPFTNTVHVTISRLRRKLGEPPAIGTITNVGYHITESDYAAESRPAAKESPSGRNAGDTRAELRR
ncbi:MAG TPA: winged helix-turn-helix domain-containing protein, partial [Thermoleophilaceae bacterium]